MFGVDEFWRQFTSGVVYGISLLLVVGADVLHWLNANAAACGVILGCLTFVMNLYFNRLNSRRIANSHIERRKQGLD